jgi:hypothetical protein
MIELSARGRELLLRYKTSESLTPAGKARLLSSLQQAVARGTPPRFEVSGSLPASPKGSWAQRVWSFPLTKPLVASAFLALPALAGVSLVTRKEPVVVSSPVLAPPVAPAAKIVSEKSQLAISAERMAESPSAPSAEPPATVEAAKPAPRSPVLAKPGLLSAREATIDGEMQLLNEAQTANQSGDSRRALTLLHEYAVRFPAGRLADVRAVARLVALCNLGQVSRARQEADRFQARYPNSPFNERVKGICATRVRP